MRWIKETVQSNRSDRICRCARANDSNVWDLWRFNVLSLGKNRKTHAHASDIKWTHNIYSWAWHRAQRFVGEYHNMLNGNERFKNRTWPRLWLGFSTEFGLFFFGSKNGPLGSLYTGQTCIRASQTQRTHFLW